MDEILENGQGRLGPLAGGGDDLLVAALHVAGRIDARHRGPVLRIALYVAVGGEFGADLFGQVHGRRIADGNEDTVDGQGRGLASNRALQHHLCHLFLATDLGHHCVEQGRDAVGRNVLDQMLLSPEGGLPVDQGNIDADVAQVQGLGEGGIATAHQHHLLPLNRGPSQVAQ